MQYELIKSFVKKYHKDLLEIYNINVVPDTKKIVLNKKIILKKIFSYKKKFLINLYHFKLISINEAKETYDLIKLILKNNKTKKDIIKIKEQLKDITLILSSLLILAIPIPCASFLSRITTLKVPHQVAKTTTIII